MLHKIRKFYYDNKPMIWRTIFIIAFILILVQLANLMTKINNEKTSEIAKIKDNNNTVVTGQNEDAYISSEKSALSGSTIDNNILQTANTIIKEFVEACNNGEADTAYNYLSKDCKEEIYPNVESFKKGYIDSMFNGTRKVAAIQNWVGNIYKVDYKEDIMATGKTNTAWKQDFITIVREKGTNKLNIQALIGKDELNKESNQYNINIKIVDRKIYKDYEEYTVKIVNNTTNPILLDTQESTKTIYLQDGNSTKYFAYTNEITMDSLNISTGYTAVFNIKFGRTYNDENSIKTINFSDVVLNYNNYLNGNNERVKISVNI